MTLEVPTYKTYSIVKHYHLSNPIKNKGDTTESTDIQTHRHNGCVRFKETIEIHFSKEDSSNNHQGGDTKEPLREADTAYTEVDKKYLNAWK